MYIYKNCFSVTLLLVNFNNNNVSTVGWRIMAIDFCDICSWSDETVHGILLLLKQSCKWIETSQLYRNFL